MTIIQDMARWVESVSYDKIPDRVKDCARLQILNVIASAHAGAISPAAKKVLAAVKRWDGGGKFPVVSSGETLSLHGALFANTALGMAHDYDDYIFLGHTGHSAVFASMLVADAEGRTSEEMLTAQVIANEIGGRFGAACLIGPHNGQMWTFIHAVETAAVAAKLMGLDARGIANAMAASLYQPNYALVPGFMGPDTKILSAAQPSLSGLMAAELAREGFTGPLDIVENRQGFLSQFSFANFDFMLTGLGKSWVTESIAFKLVPGCAYIDTSVDAMRTVLEDFKRKTGKAMVPQDVREITVKASMLTTEMNHLSASNVAAGELNPIAINFSIPANLAIMVLTGDLTVERLDPDWLELHKEEILSLCRRTRLEHDWSMSIGVSDAFSKILDLRKIANHVGVGKLIAARRRAAKHFGGGIDLGLKDLAEMRRSAGEKGRDVVGKMATGFIKGLFSSKRSALSGGAPDLGDSDFSKFRMPFAAEVTLRTTDWKEYTARQDIPLGGPGRPWEETVRLVREKYRRECRRSLAEDQIKWVDEHAGKLEKAGDVRTLLAKVVHVKGTSPAASQSRSAAKSIPISFEAPPAAKPAPAVSAPAPRPAAPSPARAPSAPLPAAVGPQKPYLKEKLSQPALATTPPPPASPAPQAPKPPRPRVDIDDELPPVIFEPVKAEPRRDEPPPPPRREEPRRPAPPPPPKRSEPMAPKKSGRSTSDQKGKDPKKGVSLRPARRGEKTPRPPKGAKRTHSRRP